MKFVRNVVKNKQHKNYQDEDKKSAISENKKLILKVTICSLSLIMSVIQPLCNMGKY